jgi:hypothetical protein
MSDHNTGYAGGTKGADPVPESQGPEKKTAPDNSTALDPDSPLVTSDPQPEPPKPVD